MDVDRLKSDEFKKFNLNKCRLLDFGSVNFFKLIIKLLIKLTNFVHIPFLRLKA